MIDQTIMVNGIKITPFFYGTAWKEDQTIDLVKNALNHGFRGIDTANQRKHYNEAKVGDAIGEIIKSGLLTRNDLFIQTKFTFLRGQDHRLPYDPKAKVSEQVKQSFALSLEHLKTNFIDSYILHGPTTQAGLSIDDWQAWRAMENLFSGGQVHTIGISNINLYQLQTLSKNAYIMPHFVQNRCFASQRWDYQVRNFCKANNIRYQGFSILTANQKIISHREVTRIAKHHGRTLNQIIFRFAIDIGIIPITGTSNSVHMDEDLDVFNFRLDPKDLEIIEILGLTENKNY